MRFSLSLALLALFALILGSAIFISQRSAGAQNTQTCAPPPPGMVSWWAGEGNAIDDHGENNGTLNGATFAAGEVGQGFSFAGDASVSVPDSASLKQQTFTIDAWIKTGGITNGAGGAMIAAKSGAAFNSGYEFLIGTPAQGGHLRFDLNGGAGGADLFGTISVTDNAFHHVAATYDGATMKIYVDGNLDTQNTVAVTIAYPPGDLFVIGKRERITAPSETFPGLIDELEFFNRALSVTEIQNIFNAGTAGKCRPRCYGPLTGLISWWDADDDDPFDRQGTNHGTFVNGAAFGTGKVGRAFSINGDNYVSIPDDASLNQQTFTIDAWIKTGGILLNSVEGFIVAKSGTDGGSGYEFGIGTPAQGGHLRFALNGGDVGDAADIFGTTSVTDNVFHHVAATYDGATMKLFVDGNLDAQKAVAVTILYPTGHPFLIDKREHFDNPPGTFSGLLDELEFFNRALDITEIQAINNTAHAGKCKACLAVFNNTTFWYPGDGNAKEIVGNGSTGTLNNGAGFGFGKVGQAFSLNQGGDTGAYVEVPDHPIFHFGSNDFSIAFWTNLDQIKDTMFIHQLNGANAGGWEFNYQTFSGELFFNRDTNNAAIHRAWSPQANTWYHLAVTRTRGTYKLFVNGVQLGADQPDANPVANVNGPLRIGSFETVNTYNLIGRMDEVQIFDVARTQTNIQSIVAAGTSGMCKLGGTFVGPNTQSRAGDATLTFGNLTGNGIVTYQTLPLYQAGPMPFGYSDPLHIADISTTATFTGGVTTCFNLQAVTDANLFNQLRILHLEGNTLVDRTSSHFFPQRQLCANTSTISPFVISQNPNAAPTAADGNIGGTITDAGGAPVSGVTINLSGSESRETLTDSSGRYSFDSVETNGFYTVTPSHPNYSFSPANRSFSLLGVHTEASFTAAANGDPSNPIDTTEFFVRQQYLDFLNREPDPPGFAGWVSTINNCAAGDPSCDRVHVSEMFFRSAEFQERGYFVYRFYSVVLGRKPDYAEFIPDLTRVSGFLTNDQLEAAKTAFANDFVTRPAFISAWGSLNNQQYVDKLLLQTPETTMSGRQALIDALNNGTLTRAQVLRQFVENNQVVSKYFSEAFVVMEYFGYLRRDPDALYLNWIQVLNQSGDARHMVEAFVNSAEYRKRFAP